jgi:hypothetical protein
LIEDATGGNNARPAALETCASFHLIYPTSTAQRSADAKEDYSNKSNVFASSQQLMLYKMLLSAHFNHRVTHDWRMSDASRA